jgi:hypothetical protein
MADGLSRPSRDDPGTPALPPTRGEVLFAERQASFALTAKYPVRPNVVMTREQLDRAYAELRAKGYPEIRSPHVAVPGDRRPLTPEQLRAARQAVGTPGN